MDSGVALVQAYLYANGYFTVTEYPVIEALAEGGYRSATDIDVLAVRFPGAGRIVPRRGRKDRHDVRIGKPDPALDPGDDRIDMIIGEVKEGEAVLNRGARAPAVLRAVLTRFGACTSDHAARISEELVAKGEAVSPSGPRVRLLAFGTSIDERARPRYTIVTFGRIMDFLAEFADQHWDIMQHAQFKDPAISFMMILEKARRAAR